ncbi:flavin monoamine oxidase family protein [Pantoea sp. LMR881]|uniref:flavin monoamine oxidase family protein n=1 Tax=Pantoea sp. LMR881 TaxID=3014336 RepID=UPI002F354AFA
MSRELPRRFTVANAQPEPEALRLVGGNATLISALASQLSADSLQCDTRLVRVELEGQRVISTLVGKDDSELQVASSHLILAMPPRLIESNVKFSPDPDTETLRRWKNTPTWMAPHAKFFAVYERPFWREAGLSGSAQSMAGPLIEIHDATTSSGNAALLGFIGMPAAQRKKVGQKTIMTAATEQLKRLFGEEASTPLQVFIKDWAEDLFTSTADDELGSGPIEAGNDEWFNSEWRHYISLAGSEFSQTEPGFLAGAVASSGRAVTEYLNKSKC